jgi:diguanylate cyclase (GGDEF)-like protein
VTLPLEHVQHPKTRIDAVLFGDVSFAESEEHLEFQFRFLTVLMIAAAVSTMLFIVGSRFDVNAIPLPHMLAMSCFTTLALVCWLLLRSRKERFSKIASAYLFLCMLEYTSALVYVPKDELRVLWFFVNIPGVYILLGRRAGLWTTAFTVLELWLLNWNLTAPYSGNALATFSVAISYMALFFHVYGSRSTSYFARMRDSNRKLRYLAFHDELTGVLNARAYYAQCDTHFVETRQRRMPFAVLFIDLDHFKSINDTHGHAAGDLVLRSVAQCLRAALRREDFLGRIGGEEFCALLPGTHLAEAKSAAERLRVAIAALEISAERGRIPITASIGVATDHDALQSMAELQQLADQAMYRAKALGRNRVSVFEPAAGQGAAATGAEGLATG